MLPSIQEPVEDAGVNSKPILVASRPVRRADRAGAHVAWPVVRVRYGTMQYSEDNRRE